MKKFAIVSDGACDLTALEVEELGVVVVPFYIAFEKDNYLKEGIEIDATKFYQKMVDNPNVFPKTSMPTAEDYYKEFEKLYQSGQDILCITISKKFSGSLNSAINAANLLKENYPDARVEVVDSILLSHVQGLLVREISRMRSDGLTLDETIAKTEEIKQTGRVYFTVSGLSYLQHGGRIGKLTAIVGNFLKINPLIIQKDGEIHSGGIALTRKRAILKIIDKFSEIVKKYALNLSDYLIQLGYGYSFNEGLDLAKKFEDTFNYKISLFGRIGATIAVHTGPHPLGIAFIKKYDA